MRAVFLIFLGGLAFLIAHALLGTPYGHSFIHNLPWYDAFQDAFWRGDLYPRFLPELWYGFGGYDFYYYGPLPFWIIAILGEISCPNCSTNQVFSIGGAWLILLSGATFYWAARRVFTQPVAIAGALVYMLLPYHYAFDWYVRQAVGELSAYIFIPILILSAHRLMTERTGGRLFAVAFAALVLSHLPSALIAIHVFGVFAVTMAWKQDIAVTEAGKRVARLALWGGIGLCLSGLYWVPALAHLNDVSPGRLYNAYADPVNWLLFDGRAEPNTASMAVVKSIVLSVVSMSLAGWYILRKQTGRNRDAVMIWLTVPAAFSLFMVSVLSLPIWQYWILSSIQFPWRTLYLADISLAIASMIILRHLLGQDGHLRTRFSIGVSAISVATLALSITLAVSQAWPRAAESLERNGHFEPLGAIEYFHPNFIDGVTAKLPADTLSTLSDDDIKARIFAGIQQRYDEVTRALETRNQSYALAPAGQDRLALSLILPEADTIILPLTGWAHWRATDSRGQSYAMRVDGDSGLMSIELPAGEHDILLRIGDTAAQKMGSLLSLFALLLLLSACVNPLRSKLRTRPLITGATRHA